ncbi:MAG TPA: hypothetical protein PK057_06975 [Brevefilum fermentans]|jgi:hypothetical protein|nr:hypothetical protein [Brevefilum fermentans]
MFLPVSRAGTIKEIQRVRRLKYPGEVLVYEGQQVLPEDVIAQASMPAEILMVEIAQSLGVDVQDVKEYLVREPGEQLHEGDVIAKITGTLSRLVRAPADGRFIGLHQGKAVFEVGYRTIQVRAGMMGVVQTVFPEYGAMISAAGFLLQGVWGNGAIGLGELKIVEEAWTQPLTPGMLAERGEGLMIGAGSCVDPDALNWYGKRSSGGLMLGSMAPELVSIATAMQTPILVVQGFGSRQPDESLLGGLTPYAEKSVSLNASEFDPLTGMRPEAVIHLSDEGFEGGFSVQQELKVGLIVRVFAEGSWGKVGEVLDLPEGDTDFESGVRQPAAVVMLNDGQKITVPQQNLSIVDDAITG